MKDDLFDTIIEMITGWFGSPPTATTRSVQKQGDLVKSVGVEKIFPEVTTVTMTIALEQLQKIYPKMNLQKGQTLLPHLNVALEEFNISAPGRMAAFLAQVGHETYQLRFTEEEWGPTPAQLNYEPPTHLATVLGNTEKGDGFRYKGRGAFQVTGRTNYRRYGHLLNLDLEGHPELAGLPENTFRIAGVYWNDHKLSELTDAGNFREITRRINGGYNGEAEREAYWVKAKEVLGVV